ncbi:hypothetical protein BDW67DRAFT_165117 [Aspergillus spinulosporus]
MSQHSRTKHYGRTPPIPRFSTTADEARILPRRTMGLGHIAFPWHVQMSSVKPVRLVDGAYVNVPELQAAYWLGGYQSRDTTPSITDDTKTYATGMIQFNTTTEVYTLLDAPFMPVQQGALVYLPTLYRGVLLYFGGEVPSVQDGIDAQLSPNSWDYVYVYDIANQTWYNQTTTGKVAPRTQFCASVVHQPGTDSWQIYVIGGADFDTKEVMTDVSYLSIPSFKWYSAAGLSKGRMSHTCQTYGRQIIGIGGRQAWANDAAAGCYDAPAFLYDAQSEVVRTDFDPSLSTYSIPSATADDIAASPVPSSYDNITMSLLFSRPINSTSAPDVRKPVNKKAIAGGVVGGVCGAAIVVGLIWFFIRRRQRARNGALEQNTGKLEPEIKHQSPEELSAEEAAPELDAYHSQRNELQSDTQMVHELDSTTVNSRRYLRCGSNNEPGIEWQLVALRI